MPSIINALTAAGGGVAISGDATGNLSFQTAGTNTATIDTSGNFSFNSGYGSVATAYGCRAWVNFNGVSGVTIRGSGNISSVTRSSAGRYDVNFTTAMPDANYAVSAILNGETGTGAGQFNANGLWGANSLATGSLRVEFYTTTYVDSSLVYVAVFR